MTLMNPTVLDAIKGFEGGCKGGKCVSYIDAVGEPTIGYGHTNMAGTLAFNLGEVWTEDFATTMLDKDLKTYWDAVDRAVKVPLTQCQMSVLTSWTYNVGPGNMRSSTLIKRVNAGKLDAVPAQLMRWNKGRVRGKLTVLRGLSRRRAAEGVLWSTNCGGR
jgi:lysozyme